MILCLLFYFYLLIYWYKKFSKIYGTVFIKCYYNYIWMMGFGGTFGIPSLYFYELFKCFMTVTHLFHQDSHNSLERERDKV